MAELDNIQDYGFLRSAGELGELIRQFPWERTPLGPIRSWPQSLRTSVSIMLNSRHPMWIGWGEHMTFLYNDAYIQVLSHAKHPRALGHPAAEVWREIWDICGPLADKVFCDGEASFVDDVRLFMDRGSFVEETFYSFSYSPIRDELGNVGGLFCPSTEVTPKILNARRLRTLSELAAKALTEKTVEHACASAAMILSKNTDDIPFALLYLINEGDAHASLKQAVHLDCGQLQPESIGLEQGTGGAVWPLADVLASQSAIVVELGSHDAIPLGLAAQAVTHAIALPVTETGQSRPSAILIAGISPARRLDEEYRTFFELVAGQVATAIHNARTIEEQKKRADLLAELDAAKTSFFSNVSHEFRTPLTLMLGPVEDMLGDVEHPLPLHQRGRAELVHRNALRLQKLVNALLDFSRIQAGRMRASYEPTDLAALTTDLAASFRSAIESAGLAYRVECGPLPEPVYVDAGMWEKIVLNLLSNAFKFTLQGAIALTLRHEGKQVVLEVSDSGVGIAAEELPRLFERFHRIEGARARTHEGSGIGLSLAHDLVKLHGGSIDVQSVPERGTTFRVTLLTGCRHLPAEQVVADSASAPRPLATAAAYVAEAQRWLPTGPVAESVAELIPEPASIDPVMSSARVLVADDNADMRDYVSRILASRWHVTAVSNGREALEAIERSVPDIIVSDVMMPELDGYGLLEAVRARSHTRELPFVLLSARAGEEARVEGMQAGADDYLVKPFSARELIARLESLLLRARLRTIEAMQMKRMEQIFAQAPVAIAILRGSQHVFELANPFYQELVHQREVVGKSIKTAIPELAGQGIFEILDQVFESGQPYIGRSVRVELLREDGDGLHERFFDFVYQPMFSAHNQVEGIAVVAYDVSELTRARRTAETASRAKDEFLAMLGHELRNPLAPILTALKLMKLRGVDAAEKERAVIERQAQHLVRLVDDLLDVSRVTQGKIELRKERMETIAALTKAVEMASPLFEERRQHLVIDVPQQGLPIEADPARFAQVIANLLTNAAKYTDREGRIEVRARLQGAEVVISVQDSGIGIEQEAQSQVFDMFVQERQALDRARGGLGLGLAIVRSITTLHGGSVSVASEGKGCGSTFTVRIPASVPQVSLGCEQPAGAFKVLSKESPAGYDILIVDDNADAAHALGELLLMYGHRVQIALDGPTALKMLGAFRPDVALLDIGLPGMDGYELGALLRSHPGMGDVRLIAVTGYGQLADQKRSAEAGFDLHLVKPIEIDVLERSLRKLVDSGVGRKIA